MCQDIHRHQLTSTTADESVRSTQLTNVIVGRLVLLLQRSYSTTTSFTDLGFNNLTVTAWQQGQGWAGTSQTDLPALQLQLAPFLEAGWPTEGTSGKLSSLFLPLLTIFVADQKCIGGLVKFDVDAEEAIYDLHNIRRRL
jgi:hypothetical protein